MKAIKLFLRMLFEFFLIRMSLLVRYTFVKSTKIILIQKKINQDKKRKHKIVLLSKQGCFIRILIAFLFFFFKYLILTKEVQNCSLSQPKKEVNDVSKWLWIIEKMMKVLACLIMPFYSNSDLT